jgi:hypothetical protein
MYLKLCSNYTLSTARRAKFDVSMCATNILVIYLPYVIYFIWFCRGYLSLILSEIISTMIRREVFYLVGEFLDINSCRYVHTVKFFIF